MSVSFGQARAAVKAELGLTSDREGYEDEQDYNVLVNPPLFDEVVLVTKQDGAVHREVYLQQRERLGRMLPVTDADTPLVDGGTRLA